MHRQGAEARRPQSSAAAPLEARTGDRVQDAGAGPVVLPVELDAPAARHARPEVLRRWRAGEGAEEETAG